ncbi:MAG: M16 family metallopeptidase [Anaerotignaceae bacterium]
MGFTLKTENSLGEKMFITTLSSGAKCYIIPKDGFGKTEAVVSFRYGSADLRFETFGERITSPLGTAHFIEHKMFEKEDGSYFTDFIAAGADTNAFTDFSKTAYYFSCKENFEENFKRLLEMVGSVYFTDENVEREKGIIGQEISMYDDDPNWIVYFNLLKRLYKKHPVRYGIAGTKETVNAMCSNDLKMAFDAFYVPENMRIVVCGNVEYERIAQIAESVIEPKAGRTKRAVINEPTAIGRNYIAESMGLSKAVFNLGFKLEPEEMGIKKVYGTKMLLDIIAGESSYLYGRLLKNGLLEDSMALQYLWGRRLSLSVIMGKSDAPRDVANCIVREIEKLKKNGISTESFNRAKKKHIGRFIRGFNSIDAICMAQTELSVMDCDLFDAFDMIKNMEKDYLEDLLTDFDKFGAVLSVVK